MHIQVHKYMYIQFQHILEIKSPHQYFQFQSILLRFLPLTIMYLYVSCCLATTLVLNNINTFTRCSILQKYLSLFQYHFTHTSTISKSTKKTSELLCKFSTPIFHPINIGVIGGQILKSPMWNF